MATNKLQWKRIAKGDKLPCQSFLRKKNGEILKLSTVGGVTVGQDAYYLPVDEVIEELRNYPIEESKDERIRKGIIRVIKGNMPDNDFRKKYIAWIEKQGEQKPAEWSEEDERLFQIIIDILDKEEHKGHLSHTDLIACVRKLKSLKDRVQPQPKQEWSGGDEAHLHSLITHLEQWIESNPDTTGADIQGENIAWLKSLKERYTWRPSEGQMKALKEAVDEHFDIDGGALWHLYEDLKKLKD